MKTFKIAHLYYDLMNLYGENGNIRYLKNRLEEQDIERFRGSGNRNTIIC